MPETLQHQPLTPDAVERLAALTARMRVLETDGVAELRALLEAHPDHPELLGHYAGAMGYRGDHKEAVRLYDRFLALRPGSIEARWRRADRLVNLGRFDEAMTEYRAVLERDPACEDARMGVRYLQHLKQKGRTSAEYASRLRKGLSGEQLRNRDLNDREYEREKLTLESLPTHLYLESTLKCNFACKMCSKGYEPYYAEDLQRDISDKVRREVIPTNVHLSITGFGEPTMASNFDELLEMGLENGSHVFFVTNASLLNFERIERLTQCPVSIIISIDGATKETFEAVRPNSNFELIMEKLAMIRKLRDIAMSHFISNITLHFVAMRMNIRELPGVVRIAHRFGIGTVGVLDYAFNHNDFDEQSLRFDPKLGNAVFDEAARVAGELGVQLSLPPRYEENPPPLPRESLWRKIRAAGGLFPGRRRFPQRCNSPWKEPYIHTDGRVTPCCTSNLFLGTLKTHSFSAVWNGWRYRLLRWRIHSVLPPMDCRTCFNGWGINGGNAGNVMAKEGLLIKGAYWLEFRLDRLVRALAHRFFAKAADKDRSDLKAPNFQHGKPMKQGAGAQG